jgi:hypothetical protein
MEIAGFYEQCDFFSQAVVAGCVTTVVCDDDIAVG